MLYSFVVVLLIQELKQEQRGSRMFERIGINTTGIFFENKQGFQFMLVPTNYSIK